jgi:membrane protein DedA with SNARE-associated domain
VEEIFDQLTQNYGLIAVFLSLVTTPIGNPIPEDASLFVAGMLARSDQVDILTALIVGYLGVILGDCIAWSIGRRVGLHPTGFIARLIGPKALRRVEGLYERWGSWAIVICRQFPGFRLPCFFFAGASGMRFRKFILIDGSAAIITTNVFVWLGYYVADREQIGPWLQNFHNVFYALLAIVGTAVLYRIVSYQIQVRRERKYSENDGETGQTGDKRSESDE